MQKKEIQINTYYQKVLTITISIILVFHGFSISARETDDISDNKIRTVVIDPGHGGKDSGARGSKTYEKDIVLSIGLLLGKYIEDNIPDVKVIYTRKTDVFIPLYKRAEIANEANADLFISLHANGWTSSKTKGTETLVLGLHRSDENFEVAKRENSVILLEEDYNTRYENFDPNSLESYIIFSLMQNVYDHQSIGFAGKVQEQFRERARRTDRGVKRQGLLVLAQTSMPGVLIEAGFVTNPSEEEYMSSIEGQEYLASAIYRAFKEYKKELEDKSISAGKNNIPSASSALDKTEVSVVSEPKEIKTELPQNSDSVKNNNEIRDQDPAVLAKENTKSSDPIQSDEIYFKVQIQSSKDALALDSESFKDFSDLEEFKVEESYKYAVGYKTTYAEIVEYSKWVKNRHPDAFIIAVKNGEIIPVQSALKR